MAGWRVWRSFRNRCQNPNNPDYPLYGGRGVKVDPRWDVFENFITDMGERPSPKHSIDRYPDKNGDYKPGNCRWATMVEQQNNRGNNRLITYNGEEKTVSAWAHQFNLPAPAVHHRLDRGWSIELALLTPLRLRRRTKT